MAEEKLVLPDGSEFDLSSLYEGIENESVSPPIVTPDTSSSAVTNSLTAEELAEYREYKRKLAEQNTDEEQPPVVKKQTQSNDNISLLSLHNKIDSRDFEDRVKDQFPTFKVDQEKLLSARLLGQTTKKALESQLKEHQKNIVEIGKMYHQGTYKLDIPQASTQSTSGQGMPPGFEGFDPNLIKDQAAMVQMVRYNPQGYEAYKAKLIEYEKARK